MTARDRSHITSFWTPKMDSPVSIRNIRENQPQILHIIIYILKIFP